MDVKPANQQKREVNKAKIKKIRNMPETRLQLTAWLNKGNEIKIRKVM